MKRYTVEIGDSMNEKLVDRVGSDDDVTTVLLNSICDTLAKEYGMNENEFDVIHVINNNGPIPSTTKG